LVLQAQQDLKNGAQFSRVFVNMRCFGMQSGLSGGGMGLPAFHKQGNANYIAIDLSNSYD
jgi:hypothetical protein